MQLDRPEVSGTESRNYPNNLSDIKSSDIDLSGQAVPAERCLPTGRLKRVGRALCPLCPRARASSARFVNSFDSSIQITFDANRERERNRSVELELLVCWLWPTQLSALNVRNRVDGLI